MRKVIEGAQSLGRALMLPIAVLPVAALLLRVGQPDLLGLDFVSAAGGAMFSHLGLLFAIGVATGFARDGNGAAPLAGVVCFLVAVEGSKTLLAVPADVTAGMADAARAALESSWRTAQIDRLSVPIGIVSGMVGGLCYNRYSNFRTPEYLAFFGGRRFVPIVSGMFGVGLAAIVGGTFPVIDSGVDTLSRAALESGGLGLFIFGMLNRLLLVTGLHHILNNVAWFMLGDFHGTTGDLRRFFAGDPEAGLFMSGFFPIMMFGLPAACLAMYRTAKPERRKATGGMLLSLAATSFLTGVTEPVEFTFMFLAPALYLIHAALTGLSMMLMSLLDVHLGFGFSAGLFDYVLNFSKAQRPWMLIPVGLAYAAIYYTLFRAVILRFDLKTPGREEEATSAIGQRPAATGDLPARFIAALGGRDNLLEVAACTTRLRLIVREQTSVDDAALKSLGAKGMVRPSPQALQVVLGPQADQVAREIREVLAFAEELPSPDQATSDVPVKCDPSGLPADLLTALGGPNNLRSVLVGHGRIVVEAANDPDASALAAVAPRGTACIGGKWHILVDHTGLEKPAR